MQVENVDIDSVIPYANNPRNNTDAVDKVAASIQAFGWQQPIVVDENMVVIVGHTRLLAAKKLGLDEVPVQVADKLTAEQAKAYRLADNRTNEYASWDMKMLGIELRDLDDLNFNIELTGFNNIELASLLIDPEVIEDHSAEWRGMPEYESEKVAYKSVVVHFLKAQDVNDFSQLIGQAIGDRTRYLWFPPVENEDAKSKAYIDADTEISHPLEHPIYIPSKGRAETCTTPLLLSAPYYLVVEPQDSDAYIQKWGADRVIVMNENDRGIAYVRNFCKEHSKAQGDQFHWQIDDDIKSFQIRKNNKNIKCDALDVLCPIEEYVRGFSNIGGAGLKHSLFAWSAKNEIDFNKQICSAGLFNNEVDASWRDGVIEDTDYSMQILTKGFCTVLFNRLIYDPPAVSSNEGGNKASGYYDRYLSLLQGLQSFWKDENGNNLFTIVEKKGEPRLKANRVWIRFTQRPHQ